MGSIDLSARVATGPERVPARGYEWKVVALLSLAFGLVGLDRWILPPLFPAMMKDLGLGYADLGNLVGVLALTWGGFAILCGNLSDRMGRRRVVIPAVLVFSLLSGLSGVASSMVALLAIRAVMGAAEGAFTPAAVAATGEASHPSRRGFNQGVMMSSFALLGFGLAPIVATQLLGVVSSWRVVFMLVGIPGLALAALIYFVLREPPHLLEAHREPPRYADVVGSYNVRVATAATFCAMSCVIVMGTMVPNYLVDRLHLSPITMGFVMSAMGWGGFAGEVALPGLSDLIGRRTATLLGFSGALASVILFTTLGAAPVSLFAALGAVAFFSIGLLALLTGPVASEAVPPTLISSAIGMVSGTGEIFGGAVAPFIAGQVAARFGLEQVFWVPLVGLGFGILVSLLLRETAPRFARAS